MKTPATPFRAGHLVLVLLSGLAVTTVSALADVHGQSRPRPAKERRPNVFERIGNFFYNLANGLERSDMPGYPGRGPSTGGRYHVAPPSKPVPDSRPNKSGAVDPENKAATVPPDIYASNRSGSAYRPPLPSAGTTAPAPSERTAPLPDATAAGSNKKSAPAPGPDSSVQGKATGTSTKRPDQSQEKDYPAATPTRKFGRVKSPYPPFTELDVTGLPTGSLAKDPVTGRIFRLP